MKQTWKYKTGDSVKGELNPYWKGDKTTSHSLHSWIRDNFNKPESCELCGSTTAKKYDWSNKDHTYSRCREDWQYICRKCHLEYDYKFNGRPKPYATKEGAWSLKYDSCVLCGQVDTPHKSKGKCRRCYNRLQWHDKK